MNATDNLTLMLQFYATNQANQESLASRLENQNPAKTEDGSSFDKLLSQKQNSKPQSARPESPRAKPKHSEENPSSQGEAVQGQGADVAIPVEQELLAALAPQNAAPQLAQAQLQVQQTTEQAPLTPVVVSQVASTPAAAQAAPVNPQLQETATPAPIPTQITEPNLADPLASPSLQGEVSLKQDATLQVVKQPELSGKAIQPETTSLSNNGASEALTDLEKVTVKQAEDAPSQPLFRELDGRPIKVGDVQSADTTAPDFEQQLGKQISQGLEQGMQKIEIKLTPDHLGSLTVSLTRSQDGSLNVMLLTSTDKAAKLLGEHAANLGAMLRSNTQAPVQVEVQQQAHQQDRSHDGQRQQQQQQQQQDEPKQNAGTQDFLQQLRLGLVPMSSEAS